MGASIYPLELRQPWPIDQCSERILQTLELLDVRYDVGRIIATMDLLQQAKNVACDAVVLPLAVAPETKKTPQ